MEKRRRQLEFVEWLPAGGVEELVVRLAKGGVPPSKIGLILRDQYGVKSIKRAAGKSLTSILAEHSLKPEIPEDLMNLIRKAVKLHRHLTGNEKDNRSKRALEIVESRIKRLSKYYIREGALPADWRYEPEKAALLVR